MNNNNHHPLPPHERKRARVCADEQLRRKRINAPPLLSILHAKTTNLRMGTHTFLSKLGSRRVSESVKEEKRIEMAMGSLIARIRRSPDEQDWQQRRCKVETRDQLVRMNNVFASMLDTQKQVNEIVAQRWHQRRT
jgi:hypothetical protein